MDYTNGYTGREIVEALVDLNMRYIHNYNYNIILVTLDQGPQTGVKYPVKPDRRGPSCCRVGRLWWNPGRQK